MSRPIGTNQSATDEQNARAVELKNEYGTLSKAIFAHVTTNHSDGSVFHNQTVADELGVYISLVSTAMRRFENFDLSKSFVKTRVSARQWSVVRKYGANPKSKEKTRDEQGTIQSKFDTKALELLRVEEIVIVSSQHDAILFELKGKLYIGKPYKLEF